MWADDISSYPFDISSYPLMLGNKLLHGVVQLHNRDDIITVHNAADISFFFISFLIEKKS